jgi:hypothetical protein
MRVNEVRNYVRSVCDCSVNTDFEAESLYMKGSWDSAVSIATGYVLGD